MLTCETTITTDRPGRYLTQLCNHAGAMAATGGGHRPRNHATARALTRDELQVRAECSEDQGVLTISPWGQCNLQAGDGILTLRVLARDEDALRAIQDIVTRDLQRFGRREQLAVSWPPPRTADSAGLDGDGSEPESSTRSRPSRRSMVVLALLAVAVIAVHVMGATILASAGWASVSLDVVLAIVALKIVLATFGVRPLRHRLVRRAFSHSPGRRRGH